MILQGCKTFFYDNRYFLYIIGKMQKYQIPAVFVESNCLKHTSGLNDKYLGISFKKLKKVFFLNTQVHLLNNQRQCLRTTPE